MPSLHPEPRFPRSETRNVFRYPRILWILCAVFVAGCTAPSPSGRPAGSGRLTERDRIVRLQIFLDEHNFGPGIIDGQWGLYTDKARARYLAVHGMTFDAQWERTMGVDQVGQLYTTYSISSADAARIGTIASTPAEQSAQKSMPYTSLAEFVAERYHTTVAFLAFLNPGKSMDALTAGDSLTVPNVTPFRIESIAHRADIPSPVAPGTRKIRIDTGERMLDVLENERIIAAFPITPGSSDLPAPVGDWTIVGVATMPWYRYDEKVLKEGIRSDDFFMIPAGPNNPVGVLWMGLSRPGIGIHGTPNPDTIGRAASHGCIRLSNWDAAKIVQIVGKRTPVRID